MKTNDAIRAQGAARGTGRGTQAGLHRHLAAVGIAAACGALPQSVHAADLSLLGPTPAVSGDQNYSNTNVVQSWLDMVTQSQNAQPHWVTPLVTVTPRLEQEFRYDFYSQNQGNGSHINNYGASKGPEFIPTYDTEVSLGMPPFEDVTGANHKTTDGWGDWPSFLLKYQFIAANEQQGNYIVTGFIQMSAPTGVNSISNDVYVVQPTLAVGKGWGDFDIQATFSQQYAVASVGPPGTQRNFGDPLLSNVAFQYHIFNYFWPEFEVNYEYWPNGTHEGLSQVLLTPGIILGRIPILARWNAIVGIGYQMAVTEHPVTNNNVVMTARLTF